MPYKKPIVSFDLDDTLYDNGPVIKHAFNSLYQFLIDHYPAIARHFDFDAFLSHSQFTRQQHPEIVDFTILRRIHIQSLLEQAGYPDANPDPALEVFLDARQNVTLYSQTIPLLDELRQQGYRMISISNGNADPHRIGLGNYFTDKFNPSNCGFAKPDPDLYKEVCSRLAITPSQLVHVGDCLDNDYYAARQAGCQAIWFNVKNSHQTVERQINQLAQLTDQLSAIRHD